MEQLQENAHASVDVTVTVTHLAAAFLPSPASPFQRSSRRRGCSRSSSAPRQRYSGRFLRKGNSLSVRRWSWSISRPRRVGQKITAHATLPGEEGASVPLRGVGRRWCGNHRQGNACAGHRAEDRRREAGRGPLRAGLRGRFMNTEDAVMSTRQHDAVPGEQSERSEQEVREDLAAAYRLFALFGMDDAIYTHLSVRVPGRHDHF
jgi:hypothetical protein